MPVMDSYFLTIITSAVVPVLTYGGGAPPGEVDYYDLLANNHGDEAASLILMDLYSWANI